MQAGVTKFRGQLPSARDLEQLQRQSPGLFDNGYFVLAAVQGAPAAARNQAAFAINLQRGGTAGQIVVVPKHPSSDARTRALGNRLRRMSDQFAASSRAEVAVGGPAGELTDFQSKTLSRLPWVVAGLAIAIAIVLMIALRAVLLPLVAVAFDVLAAGATFGVLALLFDGKNPPLGGPGYIDPMTLIETFTAVFGLSLVFLVLLLTRTREEYLATGDVQRGLSAGMRHTAAGATGVGFVMLAAVIPFASTQLILVRQLMVGVAIVVLLDVLIVRPVLMPAAVAVLGRRGWWPTWAGESDGETRPQLRLPRLHTPHRRRAQTP
jgi:RND superfamily putative drug exporter